MMLDQLKLIGREGSLFQLDLERNADDLKNKVSSSRFLVIGAGGSIGQAVTKEVFKRNPRKLHLVDVSENNLVELVRDLRSSFGYIDGEFRTYCLDIGSAEYDAFINNDGSYDYVLNLSALKHVRSERDPYTLMRMINVNILNTVKTLDQAISKGVRKYFCVSTDKAANPVNLMGASKRIMEMFLYDRSDKISISTARFANVAFSDGSLLDGFTKRFEKKQPIVAPNDVRRYFVTHEEAGVLCLMSCILGGQGEIFFPKLSESLHLITFSEIAERFLVAKGFRPALCSSEEEARRRMTTSLNQGEWPCLFRASDTTGEKNFEEFYTGEERIDLERFVDLGVLRSPVNSSSEKLYEFWSKLEFMRAKGDWAKKDLIDLFRGLLSEFSYEDVGKFLDGKM